MYLAHPLTPHALLPPRCQRRAKRPIQGVLRCLPCGALGAVGEEAALDIEGAETAALQFFPFDEYQCVPVERDYVFPIRLKGGIRAAQL